MIIVNITIVLSLVHMTLAEDNRLLHLLSSSGTQMLSIHSDQTFYPASIYDLPMGDMGKKLMPCYIPEESLEKKVGGKRATKCLEGQTYRNGSSRSPYSPVIGWFRLVTIILFDISSSGSVSQFSSPSLVVFHFSTPSG